MLKTRPGQQQPARAPHQPPIGERHRQRTKLARLCGGQRVVQPPPPGRVAVERGERVGKLGQPEPPDAEYRIGGMPRRPRDQAVQHRREAVGQAGQGCVQDDRVARPDPGARPPGGGKERGFLQPRQDRMTQLRVQLAPRDRTRDHIEQAGSWCEAAQQPSVDLGRLIEKEAGERARRDMAAVGTERERGEQQRREAKRFVRRRGRVHDGADPIRQAAGCASPFSPPSMTGTAQRTDHDGRARSSAGRPASSPGSARPPAVAVRHLPVAPSTVIVTPSPSCAAVNARVVPSTSISMVARAGNASRSAGPVPASSRLTSRQAASSRRGSVTAVVKPSGGAPSAANGSRSTGR